MNGGRQRGTKLCVAVERREAREAGVHEPQLVAGEGEVVHPDVAGGVTSDAARSTRRATRAARAVVATAGWFWKTCTRLGADRETAAVGRDMPIGLGNARKCVLSPTLVGAHDDDAARSGTWTRAARARVPREQLAERLAVCTLRKGYVAISAGATGVRHGRARRGVRGVGRLGGRGDAPDGLVAAPRTHRGPRLATSRDPVPVRLELVGVAAPLVGMGRVERVPRVRAAAPTRSSSHSRSRNSQRRSDLRPADRRRAGRSCATHHRSGSSASRSSSSTSVAVAHCAATISASGSPDELAPPRREQQRPRRAVPSGERRVGDEPPRPPGVEHAADRLARVAVEVHEARVGERRGEERDPQRVLRGLLEHPHGTTRRHVPVAVAQLGRRTRARNAARPSAGVASAAVEPIRVPVVRRGLEPGDRLDHVVALAADREQPRRACERLEQQRAARARRRHDEDRLLDPKPSHRDEGRRCRRPARSPARARAVGPPGRTACRSAAARRR